MKDKLLSEAKRSFRPELLNRFDETVVFRRLETADIRKILDIELSKLSGRLEKLHVSLAFDRRAKEFLAKEGYSDGALGARPLKRVIQRHVEDPLSEALLSGRLGRRLRAHLSKDGKNLKFKAAAGKATKE